MPQQEQSDFELVYLNGQEHGGAPVFKDVRLTQDSEKVCEQLLERAQQYDKRIRSESELERCVDTLKELRINIDQLKWLKKQEREPWVRILAQIDAGIGTIEIRFLNLANALKQRVTDYRTEIEQGRQKQYEDLQREARDLEQKAKYDSNAEKRRQAAVAAKQKHKESKEFKPKAAPGFDTVEYFEYEVEKRELAAKFPQEAVYMECQSEWFDKKIREARRLGQPVPVFPGIRVIRKTRIRLAK